jgi:uncharacterized membrane protein
MSNMTLDPNLPVAGNRRLSLQAARVFLVLALAGASYLAYVSLSGGGVAGCGPGSGCSQVLSSRWAYWLGVPVSIPAIAIYLGLLITTWTGGGPAPRVNKPATRCMMVALGGLIVLAAVWFGVVQYAIIKHWCKFCLATHASALAAVGLLLRDALGSQPAPAPAPRPALRVPKLATGVAAALLAMALLITGQLAINVRRGICIQRGDAEVIQRPIRSGPGCVAPDGIAVGHKLYRESIRLHLQSLPPSPPFVERPRQILFRTAGHHLTSGAAGRRMQSAHSEDIQGQSQRVRLRPARPGCLARPSGGIPGI